MLFGLRTYNLSTAELINGHRAEQKSANLDVTGTIAAALPV